MNMYVYVYSEKSKKDKTNFILWFKELIKYNAHWFSSSLDWLHNQSKYYSLRLQFLRCTHKHAYTHTPQMHAKLNQSLQNNRKLLQYFEFLKSSPPTKKMSSGYSTIVSAVVITASQIAKMCTLYERFLRGDHLCSYLMKARLVKNSYSSHVDRSWNRSSSSHQWYMTSQLDLSGELCFL